jgi:hypothetical protein
MNNQLDYALNGSEPLSSMLEDDGTNFMQTVFQRRRDAAARGLDYQVQWSDNLVSNVWNSAGSMEIGSESVDEMFETVTNQVPVDVPQKFTRLKIEASE